MQPDDAYWRRPTDGDPPAATSGSSPAPEPTYPGLSYQGPPAMTPPPAGWHPPEVVQPTPARRLPAQDHGRIDEAEARARTVTQGVGIVVGAVLLIALCALCARVLF